MGNPLICTWGRPLAQGNLETGTQCHSAWKFCTHSTKTIWKRSTSCKCRATNRLCTSSCPPENCYNQTNLPLYPGIGGRLVQFQSLQPTGANIRGEAMRPPWMSADSSFTQTNLHSTQPYQPKMRTGQTHRPAPELPLRPKHPPIPPPPKVTHQRPSGLVIRFQTAHDQWKVK